MRDILLLAAVALFVRLPFFCDTVIHWHESTYILEGQDLLNGHLPQTVISELKPPFAALPYALFIAVFGHSVAAVRFGGLICVLATALAIYFACRKHIGRAGALTSGIAVIVFTSIDSQAGCTMIEHIAMVPLSLAALMWTGKSANAQRSLGTGLLIGIAAALKTNLALFILAPLMLLLMEVKWVEWKKIAASGALLAAGLLLPKFVIFIPYALTTNLDLLWQSTVVAPCIAVAQHKEELISKLPMLSDQLQTTNIAAFLLIWVLPLISLIMALRSKDKEQKAFMIAMAIFFACGLLTIFAAWTLHARRYYIILVPFLAALAGYGVQKPFISPRRAPTTAALGIVLALSLQPLFGQYEKAWELLSGNKRDTAAQVIDYLRQQQIQGRYVYFHTLHIGYWLTNSSIPTRYIHPTDLDKENLLRSLYIKPTTPLQELNNIFAKQPVFVVTRIRNQEESTKESEFTQALDKRLDSDYNLVKTIDNVGIFKNLKHY